MRRTATPALHFQCAPWKRQPENIKTQSTNKEADTLLRYRRITVIDTIAQPDGTTGSSVALHERATYAVTDAQ